MADAVAKASALRIQLLLEQLQEFAAWRQRPAFTLRKPIPPEKLGRKATAEDKERQRQLLEQYAQDQQDYDLAFSAWSTPPSQPDVTDMVWMERIREARFPEDYGTSKHRKPEPDYDAANWLDSNGMDREQLGALLRDPPEVLALAIADEAGVLYARIMATGFDPAAPPKRKADDETE
jgi:hypothetical protein